MFKAITYEGFERDPELRKRVEKSLPTSEHAINSYRDESSIGWRYQPTALELELSHPLLGLSRKSFEAGNFDPKDRDFRDDVGDMYMRMLLDTLGRQVDRMKQYQLEAAEANSA